MKRNILFSATIITSVLFTCSGFAKEIDVQRLSDEKTRVMAAGKKNKEALKNAEKVQTNSETSSTVTGNTDAGKTSASSSKQSHDAAQKIIDNLK